MLLINKDCFKNLKTELQVPIWPFLLGHVLKLSVNRVVWQFLSFFVINVNEITVYM